jgi:hypothetical protein
MNREKKQMVVLGVLALMIVSVGAFQFMGGSPPPPPAVSSKDEEAKKAEEAKAKEAANEIKNPDFADPLNRRDPFQVAGFAKKPEEPKPKVELVKNPPVKNAPKFKPLPKHEFEINGGAVIQPMKVDEPKFSYTLSGIIAGAHGGAVFTDASGNQKLVEVGQGIDGDSVLLSVSRDKVRVKFHAKTLVLTVGGNPSAK